jgi:hypothetical protein
MMLSKATLILLCFVMELSNKVKNVHIVLKANHWSKTHSIKIIQLVGDLTEGHIFSKQNHGCTK